MLRPHARMRIVAYLHAENDGDTPAPWRTVAGARRMDAIERWAAANEASVMTTSVDRAPSGLDETGDRVGFLRALAMVRDGDADAICLPSLDELDEDVVVQELLLNEARASHVTVVSALDADHAQLADPPADPARALVRRVIDDVPRFQGEMRSLRAWMRRSDSSDFAREAPAMSELESMQERGEYALGGASPRKLLRTSVHQIAARLRARRLRSEEP